LLSPNDSRLAARQAALGDFSTLLKAREGIKLIAVRKHDARQPQKIPLILGLVPVQSDLVAGLDHLAVPSRAV
jgi:hypothetical protein